MKISKILHPEIILDRRGPEDIRKYYKFLMKDLIFEPGIGFSCGSLLKQMDPNQASHILMSWKFKKEIPTVYHVGKDFSQALMRIDKEVPLDMLPKRFFGYFSFVENTIHDGENFVQGAYIFIGEASETDIKQDQYGRQVIWVIAIGQEINNDIPVSRLLADLTSSSKMNEILTDLPSQDYDITGEKIPTPKEIEKARNQVYKLLINLVLYLGSVDSDVQNLSGDSHLSLKKQKKREQDVGAINLCSVPVTLVSWNYKKPVMYSKDGTWVDTFPRWQRHKPDGPGTEWKIKLIWVEGFERKFKHVKKDTVIPV